MLTVSKKQERSLNFFWYGFLIFTFFSVLASSEASFISAAACQGIQIVGFVLMIIGAGNLFKFKFDDKYLEIIFVINLVYSISVLLRGFQYDFKSLKLMFLDVSYGILPYLAPLVLLLSRNIGFYKKVFTTLLILGVFFILYVIFFYNVLHDTDRLNLLSQGLIENFSASFAFATGFFLLNYFYYIDKNELFGVGKKNLFAIIVMLIHLYFAIYRARRGLIFMCVSTIACIGLIYLISSKRKVLVIIISILLTMLTPLILSNIKIPSIFNYVSERGTEDTRTGVEEYMYADMTANDWVFGKGINGKYYCPIVENVNDATGYREYIETGYLQIILKGGLIRIGLLFLILIPAIYKGLFYSKNILSKTAAMWIILWIVYLYPGGGIDFTMRYLLVWISVGICFSKKIRNISDSTIKIYLQN